MLFAESGGRIVAHTSSSLHGSFDSHTGAFAALWQEYARADTRWGTSDATVVSIELITVLMAGPLCVYIMDLMRKGNQSWRYWT